MKTEKYTHNGKNYTIEVTDLNAGGVFGPRVWKITAADQHNARVVEATLGESLGDYIQKTMGKGPADFLSDFAKSEIVRKSGRA